LKRERRVPGHRSISWLFRGYLDATASAADNGNADAINEVHFAFAVCCAC
jgi:hypothetical protein